MNKNILILFQKKSIDFGLKVMGVICFRKKTLMLAINKNLNNFFFINLLPINLKLIIGRVEFCGGNSL